MKRKGQKKNHLKNQEARLRTFLCLTRQVNSVKLPGHRARLHRHAVPSKM
jgi:hypothetical protein